MNNSTDSVRIVIFDEDETGRFLVISEKDDPDNLKLPGGKFNSLNETPDQAAERELFEELSIPDASTDLTKEGELVNDDGFSKRFIYSGKFSLDDIKPSGEIAKVMWVTADSIPDVKNWHHILTAVTLCRQSQG